MIIRFFYFGKLLSLTCLVSNCLNLGPQITRLHDSLPTEDTFHTFVVVTELVFTVLYIPACR